MEQPEKTDPQNNPKEQEQPDQTINLEAPQPQANSEEPELPEQPNNLHAPRPQADPEEPESPEQPLDPEALQHQADLEGSESPEQPNNLEPPQPQADPEEQSPPGAEERQTPNPAKPPKKPSRAKKSHSFSFVDFIINKRKSIKIIFAVIAFLNVLCYLFVDVNYDLTKYLPSYTKSQQGIAVMKQEFGYPGTARVMVDDVTFYQAKSYKQAIQNVEGVDSVVWADAKTEAYQASPFIRAKDIKDYYKDGYSVMDIVFTEGDTSKVTSHALDKIQEITGSKGHITGSAIENKSLSENLHKEMIRATLIVIGIVFVILLLTTTSWFLPILFLLIMGVAIIINMGTNIILGEISFLTASVAIVLQLAVAMDYSIFLISSFTAEREKGLDLTQSVANAIRRSAKSILACGLATFFGFAALALMKFSIGFDLGICLAKGILTSVITVLFLMPSLILSWANLIEKTSHRPLIPPLDKFARASFRFRYIYLALALIVAVPAYIGKDMNDFTYGAQSVSAGQGTKVYLDDQAITQQFGRGNLMLVLVPNTSVVTEKALCDKLEDLEYVKSVTAYANIVPQGIPETILPESIVSQVHTKNYARLMVYVRSKEESSFAFQCSDEIQALVQSYYPTGSYVVGMTPYAQDIKSTIVSDYSFVDFLSLLSVAIVITLSFHSILIAILVIIPIEIAVFVNMLFPYLTGVQLIFMGYIIISCIQLGATVDYAILMTNNYLESRETMDRREANIHAVAMTTEPLLTSAVILTMTGYTLYYTSTIGAISDIGHLLGRGTILSLLLVVTVLPALLYVFDGPITRHIARMRQLREKADAKRIEKRNRILQKLSGTKAAAALNPDQKGDSHETNV
ncbi:efflux RND transporter permease subunit [Faecalispora anaeroviscerum]|uniref:efflux RND transporter permease subunit n=1 Tax=Faecalispora anaeroviscerum TaxID=2991836 RepID=UPI0024BBA130|nr:MMPL family transporter [Faecalispora anaeroviscerum]